MADQPRTQHDRALETDADALAAARKLLLLAADTAKPASEDNETRGDPVADPGADPGTFTLSDTAATLPGEPDTTAPPLAAGDRFAGYTLVRVIGQGGMGTVWEAVEVEAGRRVAVKVMRHGLAASPGARKRFLREARAQAAVQHPNVVPLYLVSEHAGTPYFVMPLLEGETLAERLRRGPLPVAEVLRIGKEIAAGLAAAHAKGLIHRDVKPGNVWLSGPEGTVRLLDFGVARVRHEHPEAAVQTNLTLDGAMVGTPAYMAPEQAAGQPVDPRADLFVLGVVLYEMAAGTHPFKADTVYATLTALAAHTPPTLSAVSPALAGLIDRLLAKKPADRWPTTAGKVAELLDVMAESDVAVSLPPRPVAKSHRRRLRWLFLLFLVVVTLGVGGWALLRPTPPVTQPVAVTSAEERLREFAARLKDQPVEHRREGVKQNGLPRRHKNDQLHFAGKTGVPVVSDPADGKTTIRLRYDGVYTRDFVEAFVIEMRETKSLGGVLVVSVSVTADGVRVTGIEQKETDGQVKDAGHDAQVCARAAVEELVHRAAGGE